MTDSALLTIEKLSVSFGGRLAVNHVSLALARGKTLGLVGESGSGKSTVAAAILRLLPFAASIDSGRILLEGQDILAFPQRELQKLRGERIAMIFQEPTAALDPVMTIGDQVAEPFVIHRGATWKDARAKAAHLLDRVGIPSERGASYPFELSGGQRQRALIAAAIALQPALLIADEPTTALDVTVQAEILDLLLGFQAEIGMAILFISHDLAVVSSMADDVAVMREGAIVETGTAADVIAAPCHPYTRALLDAARTRTPARSTS